MIHRRQWLSQVAAALAAPAMARGTNRLAAPNLADDQVLRTVAGIRPYRKGGVRLEREVVGNKTVIHNYGHGGAGFTLSWGSAQAAIELLPQVKPVQCAVLGAGVVGLSTAAMLLERGVRVRIIAQAFPPHTTSDVAGAEWSPDIVDRGVTKAEQRRFDTMLRTSWQRFQKLRGETWGVTPRSLYEADDVASGLDQLPPGLTPPAVKLRALPFAPHHQGRVFQTMLIEAPIYMQTLLSHVKAKGAVFEQRKLRSPLDPSQFQETVIFNCLGLGAADAFVDKAVVPIRGQLVHLKPQPLPYLLDHPNGYILPRKDALVLGGTFEVGESDPTTDPITCARILEDNRRFFTRR
jgi:D-amino-acid oxidase